MAISDSQATADKAHRQDAFDAVSEADLRAAGSLKWSAFPGQLPAWVAEMDFGLAAPITERLLELVSTAQVGYLPSHLVDELGLACRDFLAMRHGWDVPAEWIRPVVDVLTALEATVRHFTPAKGRIVVPTPAYMPFIMLPAMYGRELVQVPMIRDEASWELDFAALGEALSAGDLLVLCNPHNPIGKVYTREELLRLSSVVEACGARVFSDEIHAPLVYDGARHVPYASVSDAAARHTVTATSASKAWNLAGLKAAQIIFSNAADYELWVAEEPFAEHGASTFGVAANIAAYTQGMPWLEGVIGYLDRNRRLLGRLLQERLPQARFVVPEGTYLAFVDCTELDFGDFTGTPTEFFAAHARVALTEGGLCGDVGAGWVRLNFATPAPILHRIVEHMAASLAK